ncbi:MULTISPECIES: zinc-dependent metalloprotease [Streptomyces]|uniref:Coenzyme F420 biosynthesis-associated protein n=2 Tax=Streptomyces TaxID=1883 RepID=A0A3R7IS23_9ACTN|nr:MULTISPECIES: zinc-dependent metalloprotease [Streptomyces]KNE82900.1 coenzyme F420 biosynthesis-associated protein [Streptomyces fradiae]OFA48750.1 coenzyme F420 biosynthesis-associated protein [Streptomyces fradiae]PQM23384.1 coenzyme F420 biosynthesis-associated protein [Streptomyces xinghaiensis]RKM94949.1 coenzyme F420 biosynthesis-associated protein [Streptomyces xinghaiensis]RNC74612.1 coenzyme F420 biosynthesis-associated protein [Streptomyces xinghaiensis]
MTSFGGAQMVDWNLAVATATRLVRPGPEVSRDEARAVVSELRRHARSSEEHVRAFTRMAAPPADGVAPAPGGGTPVLVIDRPGWIRANVAGFRELLKPLLEKVEGRRAGRPGGAVLSAVGSKVTGMELGALLSFLASRVLGQYETFAPPGRDLPAGANGGRLLLVAPNIVHVERELDVEPHDFRLWVCLHEETHRTQFSAVPWLSDHIEGEIQTFLAETDIDPGTLLERVREAAQSLAGGRTEGEADGGRSFVELVQTPAQREVLDRITAVMSLLEGHADFVMDGVGPDVVPSVAEIREKFQQRRASGAGRLDQALRKLLGLDAKLRQYRDGERFVRAVVKDVGMDGFNRVWTSPNTLPTKAEIAAPAEWVARVHRKES